MHGSILDRVPVDRRGEPRRFCPCETNEVLVRGQHTDIIRTLSEGVVRQQWYEVDNDPVGHGGRVRKKSVI